MYSVELPINLLIEIADIFGLDTAFKSRAELVYPPLLAALHATNAAKSRRVPSEDELKALVAKDLSDLEAKARTLRRTFKGIQDLMTKLPPGEPKGIEAIGLDRLKQMTEETRRLKANFVSLIEEFDDKVRKSARPILFGSPDTTKSPSGS